MKQIVFLIHGIGTQGTNWHASAEQALRAARTSLGRPDDFDDRYKVVPLLYDDKFQTYWDAFNSRATALQAVTVPASANDIVRRVVDLASQSVPDDNEWLHTWGDAVLYLTTEIGSQVREHVWNQIVSTLQAAGTPRFSIIAHSLGTRVIHDVLQRAYTGDVGSVYNLFGKPKVLVMIANVVRLTSFNEGHLGPGMVVYPSSDADKGACWRYVNAWHPLDPIARIRQFRTERYPAFAQQSGLFNLETEAADVVEVKEVHNLNRYLEIPDVSAAIYNCMDNITTSHAGFITAADIAAARTVYEATRLAGQWEEKVEAIENLDLGSIESWETIMGLLQ